MGTNYYWYPDACPSPCAHCAQGGVHIGKSSAGWCFSLHVRHEDYGDDIERAPQDLDDWILKWNRPGTAIRDEYGRSVTPEEMLLVVTARNGSPGPKGSLMYASEAEFYQRNYAQPGPNDLVRHAYGHGCIGHGEGTWDLITGDFS